MYGDLSNAVLRYSIELQTPGCMHIILENISASPPYLLENRSFASLRYRQAGYPGIPYKDLPPYSGRGFVSHVPRCPVSQRATGSGEDHSGIKEEVRRSLSFLLKLVML